MLEVRAATALGLWQWIVTDAVDALPTAPVPDETLLVVQTTASPFILYSIVNALRGAHNHLGPKAQ